MALVVLLWFGALCGSSDSREVWISLASMPAAFSASSTLPIVTLLASEASRAVLPSEVTPASTCARSGATDIVASPETVIAGGKSVCANTGAASSEATPMTPASSAGCLIVFISGARTR
jgi:hypothetical protein